MSKNLTTKKKPQLFRVVVPSDSAKNGLYSVAMPQHVSFVRTVFPSNLTELWTAMRFLDIL